jgi:hypothetical protein
VHFCFDNDDPGYLSINGPQHDNDHVNIQDIEILPTTDEILAVNRPPWMPKTNIACLARISVRVANYLAGLQDSSNKLQRLANILRDIAIAGAFRSVTYCGQSMLAIAAPCLEVELQLVQVLIKKLMERALLKSPENLGLRKAFRNLEEKIDSGTEFSNVHLDQIEESRTSHHGSALLDGSDVVMAELYRGAKAWGDVHNLEDTLDLSSSSTKEHFADSIKATITLCKEYLSTVGRFSSIAKALNDDNVDPDPTSLPGMYIIETRFVERAQGSHILGQPETC